MNKAVMIAFFGITAIVSTSCSCARTTALPSPPVIHEIAEVKEGVIVDFDFVVDESRAYAVELSFPFTKGDQADRALAWSYAGGAEKINSAWSKRGAPFSAELTIDRYSDKAMVPVLSTVVLTPQLTSWGASLSAELGRVTLAPGNYRLHLKIINVQPLPSSRKVNVGVIEPYSGK